MREIKPNESDAQRDQTNPRPAVCAMREVKPDESDAKAKNHELTENLRNTGKGVPEYQNFLTSGGVSTRGGLRPKYLSSYSRSVSIFP
jgi:hypothetical protein